MQPKRLPAVSRGGSTRTSNKANEIRGRGSQGPRPAESNDRLSFVTFLRTSFLLLTVAFSLAAQAPSNLQLFLLIGQSNMAGRGTVEAQDKSPIPNVWMLDKELKWVLAVDPMHFDRPERIGVGLGRSFAKVLLQADPSGAIGLIPAAVGGTSLDQWAVGGTLYTDAVRRAKAAMPSGTLRGILWHQGENDASDEKTARSYKDRWTVMIMALRKELGAGDVPVVVGQLGEFLIPDRPATVIVNEQLATIPLSVPVTAFASAARLGHQGDKIHFDSPAYRELGRRYGLAFLGLDAVWGRR